MIMKKIQNILSVGMVAIMLVVLTASCNKNTPEAVPNRFYLQGGNTIGDIINTDPNYSILKAAVTKAGLLADLSDRNKVFTVFAPNDAAFNISGIPAAAINVLPATTIASILQYHIIPGKKLVAAEIPTSFPNTQFVTSFIIPAPNTNPLVRFSTFVARGASGAFVNNIPITATDIDAANGVMHRIFAVTAPPTRVLLDTIARDADLQYLVAAVLAADAGVPSGQRFQDYLVNPLANFTVMAPTNQAFNNLFAVLGLPQSPASFALLPATTVRGILAYHVLLARAFSPNLPATPTPVPTLLSASLPVAPPLTFDATQGVKGFKNPIYSKITATDRHAINGVYHKIDMVLLPQ